MRALSLTALLFLTAGCPMPPEETLRDAPTPGRGASSAPASSQGSGPTTGPSQPADDAVGSSTPPSPSGGSIGAPGAGVEGVMAQPSPTASDQTPGARQAGPAQGGGGQGGGGQGGGGQGGGGDEENQAVPVRLDVQPPTESAPRYTQAELRDRAHVTLSGVVVCDGCSEALVLRIVPFQVPGSLQTGSPPGPLTVLPLSGPGAFRALAPVGEDPLVLELLVDGDGDGAPDRGERMAVVVDDGRLIPNHDRENIRIDATDLYSGPPPGSFIP